MPKTVECQLCPRRCRLLEGQRGDCRVRIHLDGKLQTLVYGNPCSVHADPIEKKPFCHVLPQTGAFSIATAGCNLHCKYCQNWQISQRPPEETENYDLPPEKVVSAALAAGCRSIAYTYSDPIVFYEYMLDTAKLARKKKLLNLMITAGYINEQPLLDLCPYLDAARIDLKGMTEDFYQKMSSAQLAPVLKAIQILQDQGVWIELINLVVPTWNDSPKDLLKLSRWVAETLGPDVPLHFSRFWPQHQLQNLPPTPPETMTMAWETAKQQGLNYVYVGNVPGHPGNNTYCPVDKKLLIRRIGYEILENHIIDGKCKYCQTKIPGIWKT